jgi:hypothetical protein
MPRAGLKLAIPATKRPQTYALDRAATGIGTIKHNVQISSTANNRTFQTFARFCFFGQPRKKCSRKETQRTCRLQKLMTSGEVAKAARSGKQSERAAGKDEQIRKRNELARLYFLSYT